MILNLIATLVKRLGLVCVVALIGWHSVRHESPAKGKAIVHVPEAGVLVAIDDRKYLVHSMSESPVVCELNPGTHRVEINHGPLVLGVQHFEIESGKESILRPSPRRSRAPRSTATEAILRSARIPRRRTAWRSSFAGPRPPPSKPRAWFASGSSVRGTHSQRRTGVAASSMASSSSVSPG